MLYSQHKKLTVFFCLLFLVPGVGLLGKSVHFTATSIIFQLQAVPGQGIITGYKKITTHSGGRRRARGGCSTSYAPILEFMAEDGKSYSFTNNVAHQCRREHQLGTALNILYVPSNPNKARVNDFFSIWGGSLISLILGGVLTYIGVYMVRTARKKLAEEKWLFENGKEITAKVTGVIRSRGKSEIRQKIGRRRKRWVIQAEWLSPTDNKKYFFESDDLRFDPSEQVLGKEVPIIIHPNHPYTYIFDSSLLPFLIK